MFKIIPMSHSSNSFWSPFSEMDNLARVFFNEPFFSEEVKTRRFKTDIIKTEDGFILEAELPGFSKEDIKVSVEGDILTVKAEKAVENTEEENKDGYIRTERTRGSYERSFDISDIDAENISAKHENGILTLTLKKKAPVSPEVKQITIG